MLHTDTTNSSQIMSYVHVAKKLNRNEHLNSNLENETLP